MIGICGPASTRAFSSIFKVKPEGIGQKRWETLKKEIVSRKNEKKRAELAYNTRRRTLKEEQSTGLNRVQSMWDKISDVDMMGDCVVSNYILEKKPDRLGVEQYHPYQFKNMTDFADWKESNAKQYDGKMKRSMTPH